MGFFSKIWKKAKNIVKKVVKGVKKVASKVWKGVKSVVKKVQIIGISNIDSLNKDLISKVGRV
jgi:phage-related protein